MGNEARARKLADRIKVIVAQTLEMRIKDPRLGFITITDVRLTADLRDASVFYTVLGTEEERQSTAAALASSKGMLRTEVGKGTGVKFTPTLEFILDAIPENAAHVEQLLKDAAESDARVHEQAKAAKYAGDVNPYREAEDS
ncbi:MAG: 30S ribosome-binding factor RbfA [Candidatus Nanopelagicales bacterium]|jgi:ribosome-binding factor A|nr:30S ribosome-binding factor RbfA [Actinomycetes bacterium]MCH9738510.1 30S ribosome-binding factor RbfA [Actinomycetes bacterium]MCH9831032.1 30S ribosome-binding factor RbfA [Actinomycetes bacterium]MCH9840787.1 30S ribosome-binding factor RbfA [Actinomycetes bacterium]